MHFCNRAKNEWFCVRAGHSCEYAVTVGGILMYEALGELADVAYTSITGITSKNLGNMVPLSLLTLFPSYRYAPIIQSIFLHLSSFQVLNLHTVYVMEIGPYKHVFASSLEVTAPTSFFCVLGLLLTLTEFHHLKTKTHCMAAV